MTSAAAVAFGSCSARERAEKLGGSAQVPATSGGGMLVGAWFTGLSETDVRLFESHVGGA